MMLLSQAAQVLGCELVGHDVLFTSVSSDSRAINAGDLFVALQGENYDGAAFVAGATQSGAVAALVKTTNYRGVDSPCPLLLVDDTRLALGHLAAHWRAQFNIPVIAVTGSNGKTTVKEMLASILRAATNDDDAVLATLGNLNNDIGVPLTLLKLRAVHRYAVIEMGMNHQGEIEYLTRLARPDVAIVNNAGSAHLAGLGSVEAVARAKGEIFTGLSPQGTAVINADDAYAPLWRELADGHTIIEFGLGKNGTVHAQWQVKDYGVRIGVGMPQGSFSAQLQVPGEHNVRNALAATAAALALHVPLSAIAAGLEKFSGVAARLQRKSALHGAMLIDDSYNANPASLQAALEVLAQSAGKKILVLGDMGELGEDAVHLHSEIGAEARRFGVNQLLALGKLTPHAVHEFGKGAHHFERIEDLFAVLDKNLDIDSTVLVKGSRFMRMERVVQHCTEITKVREETYKKESAHKLHHPSLTP
ncbi:MAG: UDP-N-acetylmuramoyl-tripeptide--D-alanyl-D-alanine ligase [Candidatus Nitrotoga sp.]|nr:UDP-N-acetylmuramoyl-tripeptide--D-alanyl-D-alanine ligase [Candidatus Nitrotoga sp.]MDO9447590.1 UDP-N-acetylmuramoyl-tripeptide--D-alanyl-D-alanine ligase [Candidatus Nitrotoga sp.]MDP3496683.1 UDP-N-acetylmuramoyl-tripeptide--D-alanyl-D-alanine ligase [Candidatus Nitrotoga sp.]